MSSISIIGAGAFGTALGISLAQDENTVSLIARSPEQAETMNAARENAARLPGHAFPERLSATANTDDLAPICLLAVPAQALGKTVESFRSALSGRTLVACCKGVDLETGLGPTAVMAQNCPDARTAILSGPSFAVDIAAGLPTALTIAAHDEATAKTLQIALSTRNLRLYRTTDVIGVELGGALKNVIAIAAGITIGAGLGESARAALMTRGYSELKGFAQAFGAETDTLSGLSGFGDLVLTCTSDKSRNYRHGLMLGRGETGAAAVTVEGVATAQAVTRLAETRGIDMPITTSVSALLAGGITVSQAVSELLSRPLKKE